ncbi:MAG: 3'-5' exoribonuclease [Burkholderiaceae bacterium]|nr:3'-5' exoribonuclease [Burkholderiaceae bacterium]
MDRLFVDTEFTGLTPDAKLISIGLVDESGKHKFYAELSGTWQLADAAEFAQREVIPHLEGGASRIPMVTLKKYLAAWIKGLRVPVMLATDSLQWDWPWIETLLKQRWPQNLARDPLLLTTDYLYEFDAFEAAREAAFDSGLRRHHALDDALANQQAWYSSGGDIRDEGGLPMLKARHRKNAEEVVTGKRSARSLWVVGKGDLKGATFTLNPASEFNRKGDGW